ncbi:MAG: hypothetical protein H7175_24940, partial [Burkholderiales bacterium]|nr:hypothetical protein [Anaerolineae bacterium]
MKSKFFHRFTILAIAMFMMLAGQSVAAQERPVDCSGICALAWSPADEHLLGAVDEFGLWLYDVNEDNSAPQFFPRETSTSL